MEAIDLLTQPITRSLKQLLVRPNKITKTRLSRAEFLIVVRGEKFEKFRLSKIKNFTGEKIRTSLFYSIKKRWMN
jgi:hypothetical protein